MGLYNYKRNLQLRESIHIHHPTIMLSLMRYYQKPSRTQQDQFLIWATPLTRTQQSQIDAQLGLATTPAPSAFLLSDEWHRDDIEEISSLLSRFHGVHHSYNLETDSIEVVGLSNCHDRSDTVS
jgi:hypothetical protein